MWMISAPISHSAGSCWRDSGKCGLADSTRHCRQESSSLSMLMMLTQILPTRVLMLARQVSRQKASSNLASHLSPPTFHHGVAKPQKQTAKSPDESCFQRSAEGPNKALVNAMPIYRPLQRPDPERGTRSVNQIRAAAVAHAAAPGSRDFQGCSFP